MIATRITVIITTVIAIIIGGLAAAPKCILQTQFTRAWRKHGLDECATFSHKHTTPHLHKPTQPNLQNTKPNLIQY